MALTEKTWVGDDADLLKLYAEHGSNAVAIAPILGLSPRATRERVSKAKAKFDISPMILDRLDPDVKNRIIAECESASTPTEGSRVSSVWLKGNGVSVHLVPKRPDDATVTPSRPYRIALIDLETAPNLGYTWGKYEQNVIRFVKEWFLLSFAVKWYGGEGKTKVYALPDFPGYDEDRANDSQLVAKLWEVLDEADLVIAHNGDRFDLRKSNARFLFHGMNPPSPYRTVDTLKLVRKHFALNSNKLDDVAKLLGLGRKAETGGFELWEACMAGDRAAWRKMTRYNGQDVDLLEKIYERLRPWHATHPAIATLHAGLTCPACGSTEMQKRGFDLVGQKKIQRFQCSGCGKWSRGKSAKAA